MTTGTKIGIFIGLVVAAGVGIFFLNKKVKTINAANATNTNDTLSTSTPSGTSTVRSGLSAIQVQNIIDRYAAKDANGSPTIWYNGGFENPNLSKFPDAVLKNLLNNGYWFALINDIGANNLNGYKKSAANNYILSFMDLRDENATININKSQVTIPAQLEPYLKK